jgi:hypothetical protein
MQTDKYPQLFGMPLRKLDNPRLWLSYAALAIIAFGLLLLGGYPLVEAALNGLLIAAGHFVLLMTHHYGHYYAAQRAGYPLRFVSMWGLLGTDIYPKDEKPSRSVHLQRAMGGPLANFLLAIPLGALAFIGQGSALAPALWFMFIMGLAAFSLGAFFPMKHLGGPIETDGDSFLNHWGDKA